MRCREHNQEIKFVCNSKSCLQGLCTQCCEHHQKIHKNAELIGITKAITMAEANVSGIRKQMCELLVPFDERTDLKANIKKQEEGLKRQKQRLIDEVTARIDEEISKLRRENSINSNQKAEEEDKIKEELKRKIAELNQLERTLRNSSDKLRKALNMEVDRQTEPFHKSIKDCVNITSHSKLYQKLQHEHFISNLTLKSHHTRIRPLKKIMNESPLYFLLDPKANTSKYLYSFLPQQRLIRIYDSESESWKHYQSDFTLPDFGSAVHDPKMNRFYWIGGCLNSKKVDSVIIFDLIRKKWQRISLTTPRSHCMSVLIKSKTQITEIVGDIIEHSDDNAILIAGGIGKNEEVLKSCELLDLASNQIYAFGQTNFGAFSGLLVTYNGSTVLRVGGLNKSRSRNQFSVVEVVQKLECSQWRQIVGSSQADRNVRWSYIELEMPVKSQTQEKPRLFYANQAAIQINPNQIFVFGGLTEGLRGTNESYLIGIQQFSAFSRQLSNNRMTVQQRFCVRWPNEKPLISSDDFKGLQPSIWNNKLLCLQNVSSKSGSQSLAEEKKLLIFDMYQWSQTENMMIE